MNVGRFFGLKQPVVLRDGVLEADGDLGRFRLVRAVLGSMGCADVRRPLDGALLAAMRLAGA